MNFVRRFCTSVINRKNYLVTTPLYYVNADPHLGHLYSSLLADVASRWQLLRYNSSVLFLSGTDEHGEKVTRAASNSPGAPKTFDYCTKISESYKNMSKTFNVDYNKWVRTTDGNHSRTVEEFWGRLVDRGFLSLANYKGWYCIADETFVRDDEIKITDDGRHLNASNGQPLEWREETNYVFQASAEVKKEALSWLRSKYGGRSRIHPIDMQAWAEKLMLEDLTNNNGVSVSRPAKRVPWAQPVPNDPEHTVYVWLDALCGYLTGANWPNDGNLWPADLHILGKDILRFHSILWPQLLIAANLEPPRNLFVHSHWTVDHIKMSKSRGNVIDPFSEACQNSLTYEGLRYFMLREAVPHSDGNYSSEKARKVLNSELADVFGNLLSRCSSKAINSKSHRPLRPTADDLRLLTNEEQKLCVLLEKLPFSAETNYDLLETRRVIDDIISVLHRANECVETAKPWQLAKLVDPVSEERLSLILGLALETVRVCSILLLPIAPIFASKALDRLAVPREERYWKNSCHHPWEDKGIKEPIGMNVDGDVLFRRIIASEVVKREGEVKQKKLKKAKR